MGKPRYLNALDMGKEKVYVPFDGPITDSYGPPFDGVSYPIGKSTPKFNWAHDDATMEDMLRGWVVMTILRDRGITFLELSKHLGVSKQRVAQMIEQLPAGDNFLRIETAITEITDHLGGVYRATGSSEFDASKDEEELNAWLSRKER